MRKFVLLFMLLFSFVLIAAACGGNNNNVPDSQNTPSNDQSANSSDDAHHHAESEPSDGNETPAKDTAVTSDSDQAVTTPSDPPPSSTPAPSPVTKTTPVPESPSPEATPDQSEKSSVKDKAAVTPALAVVSPKNGVVIEGEKVTVKLKISNFKLVDFRKNTASKKGEGHVHAWLDSNTSDPNAAFKLVEGDTITFDKVAPGNHKLTVQLVENNHQPLQPVIKKVVTFTTKSTEPTKDVSEGKIQTFTISIENYTYSKEELTIPVGSEVKFVNKDKVGHTATVDGKFDSDTIKQNESYTVKLEQAGEYEVYCKPHPFMKMKIIAK